MQRIRSRWTRMAWGMVMGLCMLPGLTACQSDASNQRLMEIRTAYDARQYDQAYRLGAIEAQGRGLAAEQAAYMAGMSAYKLGRRTAAINHLAQAARSSDRGMAGDALATMGLIYAQMNNHSRAADCFLRAADRLTGQARANAYFYAAVSQQKLGIWGTARANLSLARAGSDDMAFKRQVDDQLLVTGYSLQVGAYEDVANAQRAVQTWSRRIGQLRLGQPRMVQQVSSEGRQIIVVQIGQFSSYATALMARQDLADQSIIVVPLR